MLSTVTIQALTLPKEELPFDNKSSSAVLWASEMANRGLWYESKRDQSRTTKIRSSSHDPRTTLSPEPEDSFRLAVDSMSQMTLVTCAEKVFVLSPAPAFPSPCECSLSTYLRSQWQYQNQNITYYWDLRHTHLVSSAVGGTQNHLLLKVETLNLSRPSSSTGSRWFLV